MGIEIIVSSTLQTGKLRLREFKWLGKIPELVIGRPKFVPGTVL